MLRAKYASEKWIASMSSCNGAFSGFRTLTAWPPLHRSVEILITHAFLLCLFFFFFWFLCQRTVYCQQPTRNDPIQRTICCLANFTLYSIHAPVRILKLKKKSFVTAQRVHYFAPFHCAAALIPPRKYRKITRVPLLVITIVATPLLALVVVDKSANVAPSVKYFNVCRRLRRASQSAASCGGQLCWLFGCARICQHPFFIWDAYPFLIKMLTGTCSNVWILLHVYFFRFSRNFFFFHCAFFTFFLFIFMSAHFISSVNKWCLPLCHADFIPFWWQNAAFHKI